MKLSHLREGQAGTISKRPKLWRHTIGKRFVVVNRIPEDRSSGITDIVYEDGSKEEFIWDHEDPEVEVIGTGKVETKVVIKENK